MRFLLQKLCVGALTYEYIQAPYLHETTSWEIVATDDLTTSGFHVIRGIQPNVEFFTRKDTTSAVRFSESVHLLSER